MLNTWCEITASDLVGQHSAHKISGLVYGPICFTDNSQPFYVVSCQLIVVAAAAAVVGLVVVVVVVVSIKLRIFANASNSSANTCLKLSLLRIRRLTVGYVSR